MNDYPRIDVVIITYRRPDQLRVGLSCLEAQTLAPNQVIVVDASPETETERILATRPNTVYVRNLSGAGNMTSSRNAALPYLKGDVVAFLDDDAYAHRSYIEQLSTFLQRHPEVQLGCCRALNGVSGEENYDPREGIGRFSSSGTITGNFAANPGRDIPIDHGLGATMWIRRPLLDEIGGFREYFGGTAAREDTDLFLRARRLDLQPWFVHGAVADHVAAPQARGRRFDKRYTYWSAHNHAVLLMADRGLSSKGFWIALVADLEHHLSYGTQWYRRLSRCFIVLAGWGKGVYDGLRMFGVGPVFPVGGYRANR